MKFRFTLGEFSGALADLGIMLPLVLALITLNGINPTSAFIVVGFAYILNAFSYHLPIPVQPLKSVAAVALALGLSSQMINAGSWWMAIIFLGLALTNATHLIQRLFPRPVVRGIQVGLGLLLLQSAWALVKPGSIWLVLGAVLVLGFFLLIRKEWAALAVVLYGLAVGLVNSGFPGIAISPQLPVPQLPRPADFAPAFWLLALPQIPLSLANSVYATVDAAKQYFGEQAAPVTSRRLLSTMGVSNLAAALFGGVPVCHGCGGLTAHYRLGARTGGAPLMLGSFFLLFGLIGGVGLLPVLKLIAFPALGVLLAYVGVQHGLLAKDLRGWAEWVPALGVAVASWFTRNLAIGFAVGLGLYLPIWFILRRTRTIPVSVEETL
jgi:xanthine/uracil/vitamin C permease (AzgA family)